MKRLLLFTSALLTACGSTKLLQTVPIETIKEVQVHDTIVIRVFQYDSIYIASNHFIDRGKDTVIIQDQQIEYRYRLLRDTIRITKVEIQRDSIPYQVRVVETKEVRYVPPWLKTLAGIGGIAIFVIIIVMILKLTVR